MKLIALLITLLLMVVPASAQSLPEAPTPRVPITDTILLAGITAAAVGDSITTHEFLELGQHEAWMPESQVCHSDRVWIASLARAAGQVQLTRILVHHHHQRVARIIEIAHLAVMSYVVPRNMVLMPGRGTPRQPSRTCSGW